MSRLQRAAVNTRRHVPALILLSCIVALTLSACDNSNPPRAPGAPTATLTTPHPAVQPASTEGWAIYTAQRFHFQAPIPPGWKARAYTSYECPQGGDGAYIVGFFPPDLYRDAPGAIPSEYPFGTRSTNTWTPTSRCARRVRKAPPTPINPLLSLRAF